MAYGGAIYAFAPAASWGLRVTADDLSDLIAIGRKVKHDLADSPVSRHPGDDRLSGIYGTVLYEPLASATPAHRDHLRRRRGRSFADRLGHLGAYGAAAGRRGAERGRDLACRLDRRHDLPRARDRSDADGVLTEVEGTAFRTGEHRFVLDPRDPLGTGFVLR